MKKYTFYIEYDGKRTISNSYDSPIDTIVADEAAIAVSRFAAKNKIKQISVDSLNGDEFRAFFVNRSLFGKSRELIYYIRVE
ncbi:hypothetical protein EWH99_05750 [Sporolactobacillus sp. THM7-7]|nr:hypothetical protein EWH99_05750 [Sporolactobacillus sp. THM7-7]